MPWERDLNEHLPDSTASGEAIRLSGASDDSGDRKQPSRHQLVTQANIP